jgi:hypothetical protein
MLASPKFEDNKNAVESDCLEVLLLVVSYTSQARLRDSEGGIESVVVRS